MATNTGSFHLDYLLPIQEQSEHESKIAQKIIRKAEKKEVYFLMQFNPQNNTKIMSR